MIATVRIRPFSRTVWSIWAAMLMAGPGWSRSADRVRTSPCILQERLRAEGLGEALHIPARFGTHVEEQVQDADSMFEGRVELGVLRVTRIVHHQHLDAGAPEDLRVHVVEGRG